MSDEGETGQHPSEEELAAWMRHEATPPTAAALFGHLRGCAACWQRWAPRAAALLLGPRGAPPPPLGPDTYELALRRAFARVESPPRVDAWQALRHMTQGCSPLTDPGSLWPVVSALLECAAGERELGELAEAHDCAFQAVAFAMQIPENEGAPGALADLRCHAWLELGNLRRAFNDFEGAEEALCESQDWFEAGSQYPPLLARWLDVAGSLFLCQRRFDEAVEALEDAAEIHLKYDCRELAARSLLKLAHVHYDAGKANLALEAFSRALRHLLAGAPDDQMLVLTALHNTLVCLVDAGSAEGVGKKLWRVRRLYQQIATPHLRIRLDYLEAKAAARQGYHGRAERLFQKTIDAFEEANLPYDAAVTALELAAFLVERGRPAEDVLDVLDGPVEAFVERQIYRELLISFDVLRSAVESGRQAAETIAWFAEELRLAAARPGARK